MGLEPISVQLGNEELLRIAKRLDARNDENSRRVAQHILQGHWVVVYVAPRKHCKNAIKERKRNVTIDQLNQPIAMVSARSLGKKMAFVILCLPDEKVRNMIGKYEYEGSTRGFTYDNSLLMKLVV